MKDMQLHFAFILFDFKYYMVIIIIKTTFICNVFRTIIRFVHKVALFHGVNALERAL